MTIANATHIVKKLGLAEQYLIRASGAGGVERARLGKLAEGLLVGAEKQLARDSASAVPVLGDDLVPTLGAATQRMNRFGHARTGFGVRDSKLHGAVSTVRELLTAVGERTRTYLESAASGDAGILAALDGADLDKSFTRLGTDYVGRVSRIVPPVLPVNDSPLRGILSLGSNVSAKRWNQDAARVAAHAEIERGADTTLRRHALEILHHNDVIAGGAGANTSGTHGYSNFVDFGELGEVSMTTRLQRLSKVADDNVGERVNDVRDQLVKAKQAWLKARTEPVLIDMGDIPAARQAADIGDIAPLNAVDPTPIAPIDMGDAAPAAAGSGGPTFAF